MIVEQRTYTLKPGTIQEYFRLYQQEGMQIQLQFLHPMLGYYVTEVGPLNQVVHLWGYESYDDRERRRAAMRAHPGWPQYLAKIHPLIEHQESKLMLPAPFFDLKAVMDKLAAGSA